MTAPTLPALYIVYTGSRDWPWPLLVEGSVTGWQRRCHANRHTLVVVHGAAPTGVDAIADRVCTERGILVERHPADETLGEAAELIRSTGMLSCGVHRLVAFRYRNSPGTSWAWRQADTAGLPWELYDASGADGVVTLSTDTAREPAVLAAMPPPQAPDGVGEERCVHELVRAQCDHCRPRPVTQGRTTPGRARDDGRPSGPFPAAYPGNCWMCDEGITPGDTIGMVDGAACCESCRDDAERQWRAAHR